MGSFLASFPKIVDNLLQNKEGCFGNIPEVRRHYERMLFYNLKDGKNTMAQFFLSAFRSLVWEQNVNEKRTYLAHVLAWSIELFYMKYVITDDVQDQSEVRQGRECWHKVEDVGLTAINDADFLEQGTYLLLKNHFSSHPNYVNLLDLFNYVSRIILIGQYLDLQFSNNQKHEKFTPQNYYQIISHKTSIHFMNFPIKAALLISDYPNLKIDKSTYRILVILSHVLQIENDISDVFLGSKNRLKTSNDIREGKCTWLAVTALEKANEAQRNIFFKNYGKSDDDSVSQIEDLYKGMKLLDDYCDLKQKTLYEVEELLREPNLSLPMAFLQTLIEDVLIKNCYREF